ncbi:DUF6100 family protein [Oscillibacter sp. MSJ-31]|uniref:DUF6100 family protein n=1 Tax=Oscillibacter sp. MSJ-31 TaxID=2841526 RepID=UPI001C1078F0|nr:DUF6100 family protein [Oscillibacter sp. MSJ-31]MBU5456705.1 hypothetical protein [Oscillibacter sp. MSJ-31]
MENYKFKQLLQETATNYDGMSQELFKLSRRLEESPRYNPEHELYSLVRSSELNTLAVRSLAARAMGPCTPTSEVTASALAISIVEEPKWLKITVPAILPSRRARDGTLFITRPLRNCLVSFQRETPIERFGQCMICIVHRYDEALGIRRVRDYDNIETKRYLDVIESVFLTNDSGLLCSVLQTTQISDRDCTEFYLMLPDTLPLWAKMFL